MAETQTATDEPFELAPPEPLAPLTGVSAWLGTVDHKKLGILYIASSLFFFVIAGLQAGLIRLQLAFPDNDAVSPETFNQLFTMHGTSMVFLVGMPFLFGFANYLVPLMIGARDMAFPRLNAFSFWLFLFGAGLLYFSYVGAAGLYGTAGAPDVGWTAYAPLTSRTFSPGNATDYWLLGLLVGGFASLATAANILVTIVGMRCEGMTAKRMPLFVWIMAVVCGLVMITMPPLSAAQTMMLFDRHMGAHFFDTQTGGNATLWMHIFWFFGHPEVYVLILPGFAYASEIIPVFSRKVLFGFPMMVAATVTIGIVGMGAWAHHMFTVGMGSALDSFFVTSTLLIGVPTGIKLFNWLATMYGGKIILKMPMLCCIAFIGQFLFAGLSGIMLASAPFDWQLHDTYFVIGHFHFVLIGGLVFTIFGAIYYWYPKAFGRMLSEKIGRWHFWLFLCGFNLTFLPMHVTGMLGMPRRIYTYPAEAGWGALNMLSSLGFILQAAGILAFVYNLLWSLRHGQEAGDDPWDAWTLEWATSSPPPEYNFAELPVVSSRRPLWDRKHPDDTDGQHE